MTIFLSFRTSAVAGGLLRDPLIFESDHGANPDNLRKLTEKKLASRAAGMNILFGIHGFRITQAQGVRKLGRLEGLLKLGPSDLFIGVLWPGDVGRLAINYSFEIDDANFCGRHLARFCKTWLGEALTLSFASHSLGARIVLETVKRLHRPARTVCIAAGAINRDCLTAQYAAARTNADAIFVLSSRQDETLRHAYPLGDAISNLFFRDHRSNQGALGLTGPTPPLGPNVFAFPIPDSEKFDHGHYLPPDDAIFTSPPPPDARWVKSADFMGRAFRRERQTWPPVAQ